MGEGSLLRQGFGKAGSHLHIVLFMLAVALGAQEFVFDVVFATDGASGTGLTKPLFLRHCDIMNETLIQISGWSPAVVLPTAALIQLLTIAIKKSAQGVSLITWLRFGSANMGRYIFTEKNTAPQTLIGQLGTASLNLIIVGMIVSIRKKERKAINPGKKTR